MHINSTFLDYITSYYESWCVSIYILQKYGIFMYLYNFLLLASLFECLWQLAIDSKYVVLTMCFCVFYFSFEDGFIEFSYPMKVPLQVFTHHDMKHRKYKYHVESPLTSRGVISSLEFFSGIDASNSLIDRYLKLHVDLKHLKNQCKFYNSRVIVFV